MTGDIYTHYFCPSGIHLLVHSSSHTWPFLAPFSLLPTTQFLYPCCSFLMLLFHAAPFFSPFIISVENKSCRMSTSQHRKGPTHFPFFSLCSFDFLPKLLAINAGIVPDVLKLSHLALKSY